VTRNINSNDERSGDITEGIRTIYFVPINLRIVDASRQETTELARSRHSFDFASNKLIFQN